MAKYIPRKVAVLDVRKAPGLHRVLSRFASQDKRFARAEEKHSAAIQSLIGSFEVGSARKIAAKNAQLYAVRLA